MRKISVNENTKYLMFIVLVFTLLALSIVNVKNIYTSKKVLGIKTQSNITANFWNSFLEKNSTYLPGLIESGHKDKALLIDPNFLED